MRLIILFALSTSLSSLLIAGENLRDWTNNEGKTISAQLIERDGGKATLKMSNGRHYEISLSTLSEADQTSAAEWQEQQEAGAKAGKYRNVSLWQAEAAE
jgi:hypothetical protein